MKKLGLLGMGVGVLLAGAAFAQTTNEVTSVNVVGYYKVTIPPYGQYALVALNLDAIDPTNQNLKGIFGDQLRGSGNPTATDKIMIFDTASSKYKTFARYSDSNYYNVATNWGLVPSNPAIASGQGFWLTAKSGSATNYDVTIMGEVVAAATNTMNIVTNLQLIGYPFSTDITMDKIGLTNGTAHANPSSCDLIYLWSGNWATFGLRSPDRKWHALTGFSSNSVASNTIPMGAGFWYKAKNSSTWTETNSYINNLK